MAGICNSTVHVGASGAEVSEPLLSYSGQMNIKQLWSYHGPKLSDMI